MPRIVKSKSCDAVDRDADLQRQLVAELEAVFLRQPVADDAAGAILEEGLALLRASG